MFLGRISPAPDASTCCCEKRYTKLWMNAPFDQTGALLRYPGPRRDWFGAMVKPCVAGSLPIGAGVGAVPRVLSTYVLHVRHIKTHESCGNDAFVPVTQS